MPAAIEDGPLGLEAVHQWLIPFTSETFELNDWTGGLPYVQLDPPISGLRSRAEADDNRQPRNARQGENPLPSLLRGKNLTYQGRICAKTQQEVRALTTAMLFAFKETSLEGEMRIVPHADYGSLVFTYTARPTQLDIDDNVVGPGAWPPRQLPFTLGLRMSDSRFYLDEEIVKGPFTNGSSHTCDNTGTAPTDPVITGTRNALSPDITVENLDYAVGGGHAVLKFAAVDETSGDVVIDFAKRTATIDTGLGPVTLLGFFDAADSTWWDHRKVGLLGPNANTVKVTGLSNWSVTYREASY